MSDAPKAPEGSAVQALIDSLAKLGVPYAGSISHGQGGKWACPNPDHDDEHASFDVHVGSKGKPIFTCTPCRDAMGQDGLVQVLREVGVRWRGEPCKTDDVDFGPAAEVIRPTDKSGHDGSVSLTAVHIYRWADGTPNFKTKRYDPDEGSKARKTFRGYAYTLEGGYKGGLGALDNVERTPYHLERFEDWAGQPIYLVEGEKAADALIEAGKAATTFHGGTSGRVEPDWPSRYGFDRFDGVRLWPDADEAGVDRMKRLAADLAEVKHSFWGVAADAVEPKDDAYDVIARKQRPVKLGTDELDALAALLPKPKMVVRERPQAPDMPVYAEVGGKPIASASSDWAPAESTDETDVLGGSDVYTVAAGQAPYNFAQEMIERFWMVNGVLTLRWQDDHTFWLWKPTKGCYDLLSDEELNAILKRALDGSWETFYDSDSNPIVRPVKVTNRLVNELIGHLGSLTLVSTYGAGTLLPAAGGVPFRNGWLDAKTGELHPAGPERDLRWNVPADYDPHAKCPEWLKFLASLGWTKDSEEYRLWREVLGYFLAGRKEQERGVLLLGPSRSGKGTLIQVCHALMGNGATGCTLSSLTERFGLQTLLGKGLATIGDARFGRSDKHLNGILLSLTSKDPLPVDRKYGDPLSVNLPARLLIATNETPNFIEASDALGQRFVVLKFEKSFLGREDRGLLDRLLKELPGIARWALGGLRDLDASGKFHETSAGRAVVKRMVEESAYVRLFVDESCVLEPGARVDNETIYREYTAWATSNNMPTYNSVKFARELLDAFPGQIDNVIYKKGRKTVRGKSGVRLT